MNDDYKQTSFLPVWITTCSTKVILVSLLAVTKLNLYVCGFNSPGGGGPPANVSGSPAAPIVPPAGDSGGPSCQCGWQSL